MIVGKILSTYVLCNLCTEMPKKDMLHPENMIQNMKISCLPLYYANKSA